MSLQSGEYYTKNLSKYNKPELNSSTLSVPKSIASSLSSIQSTGLNTSIPVINDFSNNLIKNGLPLNVIKDSKKDMNIKNIQSEKEKIKAQMPGYISSETPHLQENTLKSQQSIFKNKNKKSNENTKNGLEMIYMDYQATTPTDPRVLDAMLPYFTTHFGNPHSRTHSYGWTSEKAITNARSKISELINANPNEIIFTSGATESNNLALKGLASFYLSQGTKPHFITLQTEHKCVLDSLRSLQDLGCEVTYLSVKNDGHVDIDLLKNSIKENTVCVSVMAINNEIGVIQDLKAIGRVCKDLSVVFHCDAAQAFGKVLMDVRDLHIGLMSISGHKIYGPKGIGALFVNKRDSTLNRPRLRAIISGGGQEFGLRSGTVPVALAVGLGKAAEIASKEMCRDFWHVQKLSKKLCAYLKSRLTEISHNGSESLCGEIHPKEIFSKNESITQNINTNDNSLENNRKITNLDTFNIPPNNSITDMPTKQASKAIKYNTTKNATHIPAYRDVTPESTINRKWYPGCLNLSFNYVEGEGLMMKLNNIALSSGSACTSSSLEPSYTLRALNVDDENAHSSIRFGISKFTTKKDVQKVAEKVVESVNHLREMSPLYEMVKEGIDLKTIQWAQE